LERRDHPERALIEGQNPGAGIALGKHHERGISKPESQVAITLDNCLRRAQLSAAEAFDHERPRGQVLDERELHIYSESIEDEGVGPRDGQLRRHEGLRLGAEDLGDLGVAWLVRISLGVQAPGVDDQRH
jgi:hypothetical protein